MNNEFHIVVSETNMSTRFIMKGFVGEVPKVFSSLFAAARHARASAGCADGWIVINDRSQKTVNRIPFRVHG